MAAQDYFSIVVFFIIMREALEASVIVSILLQVMNRVSPRLKRQVWYGAALGITLSLVLGAIFIICFYVAKNAVYGGNGAEYFEGAISWFAALLITILAFAMLRFYNIEARFKYKLESAARKAAAKSQVALDDRQAHHMSEGQLEDIAGKDADAALEVAEAQAEAKKAEENSMHSTHKWAVFGLAFASIFREGVESVLFVFGVGSDTSAQAIPLAAFAGLLCGIAVGLIIYYSGRQLKDFKIFFICTTVLLLFIAAGQVGNGQRALNEGFAFGPNGDSVEAAEEAGEPIPDVAWYNVHLYDWSECCSEEKGSPNAFFPLVGALFGYIADPSPLWYMCYASYWILVVIWGLIKWQRGTLFDKDGAYRRRFVKQGVKAESDEMEELIAETKAAEKRRFRARLRAILTCSPMPTDLPAPPVIRSLSSGKDVQPMGL